MFQSTKKNLKDILREAERGRLQLPDFQRSYVWGDPDVRSLIASIARGFPVGALLTLQTGGEVRFAPRPLQGITTTADPEILLLDGQQRITSLYGTLKSPDPILTRTAKGREVRRFYYIDMAKAVANPADIEDAIVAVDENRREPAAFGRTELDLSTPEAAYERHMFPLNRCFDNRDWFFAWRDFHRARGNDPYELEKAFDRGVLDRIDDYEMPIIELDRRNGREAICLIFEKVNVGGKKLDAFELVTAIFAADEFRLRDDWAMRKKRMVEGANRRDVLADLSSLDFLQACTLLHTRAAHAEAVAAGKPRHETPEVSLRRDAVLALPLDAYRARAGAVERGFVEAATFLNENKIIWHRDVPYPQQTVALAALFAILGERPASHEQKRKIARWYWSVALGELYGSSSETRIARDVPELAAWLTGGGAEPRSLDEATFRLGRLRTLRGRQSAAYKAVHALLMENGCRDFISGRAADLMTFFNDRIDIHHVFPRRWCEERGIAPAVFNAILNKTALSKRTNIEIGGSAPSAYLRRIEERYRIAPAELDAIVASHRIDPAFLRNDDFEGFMAAREQALGGMIAAAMGRAVIAAPDADADAAGVADEEEYEEAT